MAKAFLPKLAFALLAGGLLGFVLPVPSITPAVFFAGFSLLGLVFYIFKQTAHALWLFLLSAAVVLGLFLIRQSVELEERRFARLFGPVDGIVARILSDPYLERQVLAELIEPPYANLRVVVTLDAERVASAPAFRQTVRLSGVAHGRRIIPYHWEPYEGSVPALTPIEQAHFFCLAARDRVDRALQSARPPPSFLAFARAELFGKRTDLDPSTLRLLQDNGLTHIIAVSGMHTSLLAAVVFFLLARTLGREAAAAVTVVSVGVFCVIVGMQPSVLRASIATCLALLGMILKRPVRLLNITAASFIIEFLLFPEHLRHVGFQLSYLAVLAISLCAIVLRSEPSGRVLKHIMPLLLIQVFTAPISAHLFYRWSLLSIFSNLLFLPVFTFLIGLAALGAVVALGWPALAGWLFWIGDVCLQTTLGVLGDLPAFFSISSNYGRLPLWVMVPFMASWIVFLFLIPRTPRSWLTASIGFLVCLALFPVARNAVAPFCVILGGERAPYVVIRQGNTVHYANISLPANQPLQTLRPLIREFLQAGVKRIERLDARPEVTQFFKGEFEIQNGAGAGVQGLEHLDGGGIRLVRDGLHIVYSKAGSRVPAGRVKKPKSDVAWLAVETDARGEVVIPADFKPDRCYIVGSVTPEKLNSLVATFEQIGIPDVLAASVDGPLTLCRDHRRGWTSTTALMESLKDE